MLLRSLKLFTSESIWSLFLQIDNAVIFRRAQEGSLRRLEYAVSGLWLASDSWIYLTIFVFHVEKHFNPYVSNITNWKLCIIGRRKTKWLSLVRLIFPWRSDIRLDAVFSLFSQLIPMSVQCMLNIRLRTIRERDHLNQTQTFRLWCVVCYSDNKDFLFKVLCFSLVKYLLFWLCFIFERQEHVLVLKWVLPSLKKYQMTVWHSSLPHNQLNCPRSRMSGIVLLSWCFTRPLPPRQLTAVFYYQVWAFWWICGGEKHFHPYGYVKAEFEQQNPVLYCNTEDQNTQCQCLYIYSNRGLSIMQFIQ